MKKSLDDLLRLAYKIEVNPIPESFGGGFEASLPQLGRHTFVGAGNTIEEALANLEELKARLFSEALESGDSIPEPDVESDDFSGRLVIRIPKYLHRILSNQARIGGVSLNQHISSLLSMGAPVAEVKTALKEMCDLWRTAVYRYEPGTKDLKITSNWTEMPNAA